MSNPDSWQAPILKALKRSHALLLADYDCTEWGPAAESTSNAAPLAIASDAHPQNPTAGGSRPSRPPSAQPQLVLPPLSMLFKSSQGEDRRNSSSEAQQDDDGRPPADPSLREITAHLMQRWKYHQYVLESRQLLRTCTPVCAVYSFIIGGQGWGSSASL